MIDFSMTGEQNAVAEAAAALMQSRDDCGAPDASTATWQSLAEFGALGLLTKTGGGDSSDLVALLGALGGALCPGPVIATIAAGSSLADDEVQRLTSGELRVTVAVDGYVPWASGADVVLEIDGDDAWRVECEFDEQRPTATLSGEPWSVARTHRTQLLDDGSRVIVSAELGLAAALLGMAHALLDRGAAHARTRVQFGRPIGAFQGVAHPLADAWARVTAAEELTRLVAMETVKGAGRPGRARLIRGQARAAALRTAYVVHQVMGGLSFAEESSVGSFSTRIRQWSLLLPDELPRNGAAS